MASKKIKWTKRASLELKNTLFYYNERNRSTTYSQKLANKTEKFLQLLSANEYLGRETDVENVRVLPLQRFLIINKIQEENIFILSFWDNRRNPKKRLSS